MLSAGELLVGPAKTLFLDEISTGLDSSTTFQIMRSLRHFAHIREATLLIALLQPTPETYHLFDDIMLLSEGQSVTWIRSHLPTVVGRSVACLLVVCDCLLFVHACLLFLNICLHNKVNE